MRHWRYEKGITETQRLRGIARSYAGVYRRRGKLIPQPCAHCGSSIVEMSHNDYDRPLDVTWMCRPCRLAARRAITEKISR